MRRFVARVSRRTIDSRNRTESGMIGVVVVSPVFTVTRVAALDNTKNARLSTIPGRSATDIASAP